MQLFFIPHALENSDSTGSFKGIWQYKLSLSYSKEHLKWYMNFFYNYSVSCLIDFESKAACIPPFWTYIRYAYVTSRVKSEIFNYLANHMSLSIWNSIFRSLVSTQLTHNILITFSKKFCPTWRSFNKFTLLVTSSKTQLIRSIIIIIIIIITVFIHTQEHPSMSLHYKNI
jgi:hypothetical protein